MNEGHRVPLTTLVLDLKDICKLDLGLTAYQTANLFTRTLGFHQTQILNAFGSADGTLSHIRTMDDFLAELSSSASEEDLLARIPPWPRLAPGSPAYLELYSGAKEWFLRLSQDLSVKVLQEAHESTHLKRGPGNKQETRQVWAW